MDLKLPTPSDVLRRYEQCESQAAIAQSLVAPLIHNTLGYDIFDPVTVTPDSSGAVGNASLKHPDARVEFAVRRHAIPRLLIAVYHDEENRTTATERLQKCLDQSPARIGAVTDGRCWDWHTRLDDQTVVRYHRTDITRITEPDRALFRAMSNDNWDTDWVLKDGIRKRYEDAIASRMVGELEEPGPEFLHLLAGMVHIGRKNATVLNAVRNAAKAGLRRAALAITDQNPEDSPDTEEWGTARSATLRIECEEPDWRPPAAAVSQIAVLRHTLDYLATKPEAATAFSNNQRMTRSRDDLGEHSRQSPSRYWTHDGWFTSVVRRVEQKARLVNTLAEQMGLNLRATLTHDDDGPQAPGPVADASRSQPQVERAAEETPETATGTTPDGKMPTQDQ